MNTIKTIIASAVLLTATVTYAADIVSGTVMAFDRKAKIIVLTDKTVWSLEKVKTDVPENLKAGDRIEISYDFNEDQGVTAINTVKILPP